MYDISICNLYSSKNKNMPCSIFSLKNGFKRRVRQVFFFFFFSSRKAHSRLLKILLL